jgi:diguanylate cyclase (GGDEF)-like protein
MPDSDDASQDQAPQGQDNGHTAASSPAPAASNGAGPEAPVSRPYGSAGPASRFSAADLLRPRVGLALLCLAVGAAGSAIAARTVSHSDASAARYSFSQSSSQIASAVGLAISHEEELRTSAATYLSHNSDGSAAEFRAWAKWARALRGHPALESLSLVSLVRTPELAAFRDRVAGREAKSPSASTAATSGKAPAYQCLTAGSISRSSLGQPSSGLDYCANGSALLGTRDTTFSGYESVSAARGAGLETLTPVYRGSVPPKTGAGRRAAFVGWVREVLAPRVLLEQALNGESADALRLRHESGTLDASFTLDTPTSGAQTRASELHHGWTLLTYGPHVSAGIFDDGDALALLGLGLLASLEAAALVLSFGRRRPALAAAPAPAAPAPREDLYDSLTSLPNRGLSLDRAERMLARAGRNSAIMVGALFVDVDWFKDVNDKLGEEAGDQLLKIVAERLDNVVRTHDTVGRYAGDEFIVLVESAANGMRLDSLARRIIEALHKPIELEGFGPSFCMTASIGVAFGRYATPEDLLRDAHMALFAAKAAGKDRYTLFNANMRSVIEGRGVLEIDLNTALQDNQFSLLYQPVYDLSSRRVVAMEALLRWEHPTKGEIAPNDFIPLAEESGLIVPIGRWVLEEACARAAAWNVAGHRVAIAVKVSANQLNRDGLATDVRRALQQSGLDPSLLALEIAETTVMLDKDAASRRLEELKSLGVKIAVDDFGSGYAYRSDLQSMPIDYLKVDRASLAASEDEDYRSWLLEAILVFGRDLSLTVIAKGVESQEQVAALQAMGCSMAQGYFMGEPTPIESVERWFGVQSPAVPADPIGESQPQQG